MYISDEYISLVILNNAILVFLFIPFYRPFSVNTKRNQHNIEPLIILG